MEEGGREIGHNWGEKTTRMKMNSGLGVGLLVLTLGPLTASARTVEGRVYLDGNKNGQADDGEPGVAHVAVSDGHHVVLTGADGSYRLETSESPALVWVCVPRDHQAVGAFWRLSVGDSREGFGLSRQIQPDDFVFIQITDAHIGRVDLVKQFAQQVSRYPVPCAFVVNTGDSVGGVDVVAPDKAQAQYDRYREAASAFAVPLFNLPGNHEHVATNVADADKTDPRYGKGLYRQVFGPTYYSWDWAGVHCLALDGTRVPYKEELGADQLAWLAEDLQAQPAEKPLLMFCHQALFSIADAKELASVLGARKVLGAFCGHLHKTFTAEQPGYPVYMSGAMSGSWWSGPNIDGTPQGFRLVQIKGGALKTVYAGREGAVPMSVIAPVATSVKSNVLDVAVAVIDFGQPVEVSSSYEGHPVALRSTTREDLWSIWRGDVDTRTAADGDRVLRICAKTRDLTVTNEIRYLVVNGREEAYAAFGPATLKIQVRGVDADDSVIFNGVSLGVIPAGTPKETTLAFEIGKDRLKKINRVAISAGHQGKGKDQFSVGPAWLEYRGKKIHDLRYASFERFTIGGDDPKRSEKELYFCLP